MLPVDEFAKLLTTIPEEKFHRQGVLDVMRGHKVDPESLAPYLFFSSEHYTRNLIYKTALFELIAIGWDIGQKSPVHNHCNQECWMAAPIGKVQIHNFKLIRKDAATSYCELEPSIHFVIDPESPQQVDPSEPIHLVANLTSFGACAVTLHVYSKPYDTCEVYDLKAHRYEVARMVNTSEYGVLKNTDLNVEKVAV